MTEAKSVFELHRNAKLMNLCTEYNEKWNNATDAKKLIDMALDAKGIEFVAASSNTAWGLSTKFIEKNFPDFCNGKYVSHNKGYTSEMFVGVKGKEITPKATLALFIECDAKISISQYGAHHLYFDKNCSDVEIHIGENAIAEVYVFGDSTNMKINKESGAKCNIYGMGKDCGRLAWTKKSK